MRESNPDYLSASRTLLPIFVTLLWRTTTLELQSFANVTVV